MSNKKLVILGIAAVIMVVLAVWQSHLANKPRLEVDVQSELIQGLNPDDIAKIVVNRGDMSVTLKRVGGDFVVGELGDYPVDPESINRLITMCLDLRTSQLYTDNPENFDDLWVTESEARNVIKFYKDNSTLLAGVIIGKERGKKNGSYVRLLSDNKVYITYNELELKSRPLDFVDKDLLSIQPDEIRSVTVLGPDGQYMIKAEGSNIVLQEVPAGKKAKETECKTVFDALTSLQFDTVKPLADANDMVFDRQFVCRLADSTVYKLLIAKKDEKTYVKCRAEFADTEKVTVDQTESQEELRKKEAKLLARDKAKKFTAKHLGWVYQIPDNIAADLVTDISDLVEDLPKPEPVMDVNQPASVK